MLEKQIESKFVKQIKLMGGRAYKFISPGNIGVPDRIVIWPDGSIEFIELKTAKGRLSKTQATQIARLQAMECDVHILYGMDAVNAYLQVRKKRGDAI